MSKIQPVRAGCRLTCQIFLFLKRSIDEKIDRLADKINKK